MSFFENTRRPEGAGGRLMLLMMNLGHRALSSWGLPFLRLSPDAAVLDCGCGGGANLRRLLKKCPNGTVRGIDYSEVSVKKSVECNRRAIQAGRCEVLQASVTNLPFEDARFDGVTAFETVYFWPELAHSFREVRRVLKPGGTFLICNECSGDVAGGDRWEKRIEGMTVYTGEQLKTMLEQAGFRELQVHRSRRGWLCVTARK